MHYVTSYTHIAISRYFLQHTIHQPVGSVHRRKNGVSINGIPWHPGKYCLYRTARPAQHCCWARCSLCSAAQITWRTHSSFSISPTNLSHHTMVTIVYIQITIPQPHWCYGHCLHGSAKQWSYRQGRRWHCHSPPAHPVN